MSDAKIRYGGSELTLHKSADLVGVRPAPRGGAALHRTLTRHGAAAEPQRLGSFQVVNVAAAPAGAEETLDELRRQPGIDAGTHVYYTSADAVPFVPTGSLYIVFRAGAALEACQRLLDELQLEIVEARGERTVIARVTAGSPNPIKTAAALQADPCVAVAEPDLATPGRLTAIALPRGGSPALPAAPAPAMSPAPVSGTAPGTAPGTGPGTASGTGPGTGPGTASAPAPRRTARGRALPLDALTDRQWHLRNTGRLEGSPLNLKPGADARVVAAWQATRSFGSRDCIVAVIDDGFDLAHDDLGGPGKIVAPWDFTRRSPDVRPEFNEQYPRFEPGPGVWVGDWHGTACAGVAIGAQNGRGILGAAPNARLMPIRWGVSLADAEVEAWFDYVTAQGAWVVSCSWSAAARNYPLSTRKAAAIARCAREGRGGRGAVICFAAGNEDRDIDDPQDPAGASVNGFATHPDVIAVAASTSRDEKAHYSNRGAAIALCAPSSGRGGRGIFTSDVTGVFTRGGIAVDAGYGPGDFTAGFGGTSSATPLVAGICALILSANPQLTAAEVKQLVTGTARKIGTGAAYGPRGHSPHFGYGCIDAAAALRAARRPVSPPAGAGRAASANRRRAASANGQIAGANGQPAGANGQPAGTHGQPAGTHGQTASANGQTAGANGQIAGINGQPAGANGQPAATPAPAVPAAGGAAS
jgi:subtilisin family serine protease